jgi:hypothetical protein
MIKRDKNFKLPKQIKVQLAFMPKDKANEYRKLMIDAIIKGSILVKSLKKKDNNERTADSSL